jgi:hypothetical protein
MDDLKVVFDIYSQQYGQLDSIWNYFVVISMGTAGFVIGSEKATSSMKEPFFIMIAYLVFAIGNYMALLSGHRVLLDLAHDLKNLSACLEKVNLKSIHVYSVEEITVWYWSVVVAFSTIIIAVSWFRLKGNNKSIQLTANASAD